MKRKHVINLFLILLLSFGQNALAGTDGVVATVQGKEISETKLQKSIEYYLQKQGSSVAAVRDPKLYKKIRDKVLDDLIGQQLLWSAAQKDNVIAPDEEVKSAFDKYLANFENPEKFKEKLTEIGFNEDSFREDIKQQMSARKWLQDKVIKDVSVTKAEIHDFYQKNISKFTEPEKVRTRHIVTKISPEASEEEMGKAMKRMQAIKQALDSGVDFEILATQKSEDTSAANGGDLGYFERGGLVKSYEDIAFNLAPGEISKIFQSSFGLHIVKLIDKKPEVIHPESDMEDQIASKILKEKADIAVEETIFSLRQAAKEMPGSLTIK